MCYLCGVVHWEILHRRDETLGNQLTVRGRGLSLNELCLHASHLSFKSSIEERGEGNRKHKQQERERENESDEDGEDVELKTIT